MSFDAEAGVLYIADSESSSIRSMHLVKNLDLFNIFGYFKNNNHNFMMIFELG